MKSMGILSAVLLLMLSLMLPAGGHAAAFTVDSALDEVDETPGDGACRSAGGMCTLRAAVQEANALAGDDTIIVPAGVFLLAISGAGEDNAASGDLDVTGVGGLVISGAGENATIVDAGALDRVFDIRGSGAVTISGMTIRNGKPGANEDGGGVLVGRDADLTMNHVVVTGNVSDRAGGGLANERGRLALSSAAVDDNSSPGGGGIYNEQDGELVYSLGVVSGNHGRGIVNRGALTLTNVTISNNTTVGHGAGIDNEGTATLRNVTINRNTAPQPGNTGGLRNAGVATAVNTIISNNSPNNCGDTTLASGGNNLSSDGTCGLNAAGDLMDKDPLLGPLAANGGALETNALLSGSPAIDAGANQGCPSTDARGIGRPADGDGNGKATCDMGAFEFEFRKIAASPQPPGLLFGTVPIGSSSDRTVTVRNDGDGDLVLGAVTPPAAPFSLTADTCSGRTVAARASCSLTLRFSPVDAISSTGSIGIPSNDPVSPVVSYELSGSGSDGPVADISITDTLGQDNDLLADFGGVLIGAAPEATVTLTNTGSADLAVGTIAGADPVAPPFSISSDACSGQTLAPSAKCTLRVRFAPEQNTQSSDTFDIPNNDPDTPSVAVYLRGSGISATGNNPPSAPLLISPENGASGPGSPVTYTWKRSVDADGDSVTHRFFLCADESFADCPPVEALPGRSPGLAYGSAAGLMLLGFIAHSALADRRKKRLVITILLCVAAFFASCGRGGGGNADIPETPAGPPGEVMSHTVSGLSPGTTYYWKVAADDGRGGESASETWGYLAQ